MNNEGEGEQNRGESWKNHPAQSCPPLESTAVQPGAMVKPRYVDINHQILKTQIGASSKSGFLKYSFNLISPKRLISHV